VLRTRLPATRESATVSKPYVVVKPVLVNLVQALLAVVLGNVVYFLMAPSLPLVARHQPFRLDLGMVLDFWFCLVAYGLIRTARKWK
jgi:hypothetical protein